MRLSDLRFLLAWLLPLLTMFSIVAAPAQAALWTLAVWGGIALLDAFAPGGKTSPAPVGTDSSLAYFQGVLRLYVLLQLALVRYMLTKYGAGRTMSMPNAVNAAAFLMIAVIAAPILVSVALVLSRSVGYGLIGPARESVYTHVDRESRFKAKNFIDTVVWRGGDVLSMTLTAWMVKQGASITDFALICALFAAIAAVLAWNVERLYPVAGKERNGV